jgi:hypothetical protein
MIFPCCETVDDDVRDGDDSGCGDGKAVVIVMIVRRTNR